MAIMRQSACLVVNQIQGYMHDGGSGLRLINIDGAVVKIFSVGVSLMLDWLGRPWLNLRLL